MVKIDIITHFILRLNHKTTVRSLPWFYSNVSLLFLNFFIALISIVSSCYRQMFFRRKKL